MKKLILSITFIASSLFSAESSNATAGTNFLEQTSQAFTQISEKAMPATVFIKAQVPVNDDSFLNPFDMFGDDFFRRFFYPQQPQQQQMTGGSGFFISSDGYIVTNNHVVKDSNLITVLLNDGREYTAVIKGSDPRTDLAVLKIEETDLPYLTFGDSEDLKVGDWAIAIGNPFGLEATLTVGVVSAKGRQDIGIAPYEDFIQTDAAINPGNSGGPLLNVTGEVIGVNTAIFSRSGGYMGIGLAIPSKMAQSVISQIIDSGVVQRAYLGVILQPVDKELAAALGLEKQEGVLVSDVIKNSPAERAGLKSGDIIVQYDNVSVKNLHKFRNDIAMMNPGQKLALRILRNHKTIHLTAILASQEEVEPVISDVAKKLGFEVEELTPEMTSKLGMSGQGGVTITKVAPGSAAANAGLRPGFVIIGVVLSWDNQKAVHNMEEFDQALKEASKKKHLILVVRHGQNFKRYYTLKLAP